MVAGYEAVQDGDNWVVGEHDPKAVAEVAATCTATGTKAHYKCDYCGRLYLNATDTEEVTAAALVTEMKTHTPAEELVNVKASTCAEEGYTGDKVCDECGTLIEPGTVIPVTSHNFVDGVCKYGCGTTGEINVSTHQGMTQVEVSNTITEENKENAFHVGASMMAQAGVEEAIEKICEEYQNDKELAEDAKKALENKGIEVSEGETVEVVVVTYLETEVKDADFSALEKEDTPVVTVEINLYYDLVATTNKTDKNQLNANNSVTLSKRNKIENPESVTLNFCLPADLIPTTSGKGEAEKAPGKEEVKKDPIEVHIAEPITPPAAVAPAPTGDSANIVDFSLTMIACAVAIILFARKRVNK